MPLNPLPIQEHEQPLQSTQNIHGISNTSTICIEVLTKFNEANVELFPEDFIEECEIQPILRQDN